MFIATHVGANCIKPAQINCAEMHAELSGINMKRAVCKAYCMCFFNEYVFLCNVLCFGKRICIALSTPVASLIVRACVDPL